jgi:hypothetical protein
MNRFDDELRLALRREEPSPDFTDRVMARIAELQKQEKPREKIRRGGEGETGGQGDKNGRSWLQTLAEVFRPPRMKWAMAGAMGVVLLIVGFGLHRYRENERLRLAEIAEGERAKEQVMLAMRIASAKLNVAQKKVYESASHERESK